VLTSRTADNGKGKCLKKDCIACSRKGEGKGKSWRSFPTLQRKEGKKKGKYPLLSIQKKRNRRVGSLYLLEREKRGKRGVHPSPFPHSPIGGERKEKRKKSVFNDLSNRGGKKKSGRRGNKDCGQVPGGEKSFAARIRKRWPRNYWAEKDWGDRRRGKRCEPILT